MNSRLCFVFILFTLSILLTGCGEEAEKSYLLNSLNGKVKSITMTCGKSGGPVVFREKARFNRRGELVFYTSKDKRLNKRVSYTPRKYVSSISYVKGETEKFKLSYNAKGKLTSLKNIGYLANGDKEVYEEKFQLDSRQRLKKHLYILNGKVITSFMYKYHENDKIKSVASVLTTKSGKYQARWEANAAGTVTRNSSDTTHVNSESLIKSGENWFYLGNGVENFYDVKRSYTPGSMLAQDEIVGVEFDVKFRDTIDKNEFEEVDKEGNPLVIRDGNLLCRFKYQYY